MTFTLSYGLFEVPTGRWGNRIGARRVLTRIARWWSAFTAMTGACAGLWSLLVVRFLFGAGEAGAFANAARVLARWFPDEKRGRAQGGPAGGPRPRRRRGPVPRGRADPGPGLAPDVRRLRRRRRGLGRGLLVVVPG
jgi:hypothetical protein